MNDHERGFLAFLADPTKRRLKTLLELGESRRRDVKASEAETTKFMVDALPQMSEKLGVSKADVLGALQDRGTDELRCRTFIEFERALVAPTNGNSAALIRSVVSMGKT